MTSHLFSLWEKYADEAIWMTNIKNDFQIFVFAQAFQFLTKSLSA